MRTRSFQAYLEKRLSPEEIAEVKEQARLEVKFIKEIQSALSESMDEDMKKNKVGFTRQTKCRNIMFMPPRLLRSGFNVVEVGKVGKIPTVK